MGKPDGQGSTASRHEVAFRAVQEECEALFHTRSPESTDAAMEKWGTACADVRPHVSHAIWMDFQRSFILLLESKKLLDAASKVRQHMWKTDLVDGLDRAASPVGFSDEEEDHLGRRSTDSGPRSPPGMFEAEFTIMNSSSRANTFGPQVNNLSQALSRPPIENRGVTAPAGTHPKPTRQETDAPRPTRPASNFQRACTLPEAETPYEDDELELGHIEASGWTGTFHSWKRKIVG